MSSSKKFFSGNSLEQAILQGARYFGLEAEELGYQRVERRHGFLKVRRRVVIEVDAENPRRAAGEVEPEAPSAPREPTPRRPDASARPSGSRSRRRPARQQAEDGTGLLPLPEAPVAAAQRLTKATGDEAAAAQEAVRRLLALGELEVDAEVYESDEGLQIEIRGRDEDVFLDDRGRLLMAMQHLVPRLIRGLTGTSVACRVDCDNFQEIRAEQLRVLAQRVAAEVRDRGRPRTLEPMAPDERRIVHMTLADDPRVETESQGSGLFKRVMVRPVGRHSRGASA